MNTKMDEVCQGEELEDVLVRTGKRFKRLKYVADSLGVSYQLLIYWIEKLGTSKENFYRKKVCKKPCKLVRVDGSFRYKFVKVLKNKCKCYVGFDHVVVSISEEELIELAEANGYKIETMEKDSDYIATKEG